MKKLIDSKDLAKAVRFNTVGGEWIAKLLIYLLRINKINRFYGKIEKCDTDKFLNSLYDFLDFEIESDPEDLKNIPEKGAFITVSNHPLGGIDSFMLVKAIYPKRKDFKVIANYILQTVPEIKDLILPVNPFKNRSIARRKSFSGFKNSLLHLSQGKPLGIFPAGEVSSIAVNYGKVADKEWTLSVIKLIKAAKVPVIPVYFSGSNSKLFYWLGKVHPLLRTAKLPSELLNKKQKKFKMRIGKPISVKEQEQFTNVNQFGRYLRAKTYLLDKEVKVNRFFNFSNKKVKEFEDIYESISSDMVENEINAIRKKYFLFESSGFEVFCTPSKNIPQTILEIGRLREITFRGVGEGTGRALDIDEYDLYYRQLIIWDKYLKKIVGGYRIGLGKEILAQYGLKGFYTRSLFKFKSEFKPFLRQGIELGRSFIVKEYQRKPLSLFLLWKGILYYLLKNEDYRYLIGPMSISNDFSTVGKSLMVKFMQSNYFDAQVAKYIKPKKKFKLPEKFAFDMDFILAESGKDFNKINKLIRDTHFGMPVPVLIKKYLTSLNAKVIGFNIDQKFNNCLDGLILLDLYDVPFKTIEMLSDELEEATLLERFRKDKLMVS